MVCVHVNVNVNVYNVFGSSKRHFNYSNKLFRSFISGVRAQNNYTSLLNIDAAATLNCRIDWQLERSSLAANVENAMATKTSANERKRKRLPQQPAAKNTRKELV